MPNAEWMKQLNACFDALKAIKDTEALLADQPCSMSWVDFAEGDLRAAREARAELAKLLEQQRCSSSSCEKTKEQRRFAAAKRRRQNLFEMFSHSA